MGIKGINEIIREYAPEAIFTMIQDDFKGLKIAVDTYYVMYLVMSNTRRNFIEHSSNDWVHENPREEFITERWIKNLLVIVRNFISRGISAVFVFDGEHDYAKTKCKEERTSRKQSMKDKIEICRNLVKESPLSDNSKNLENIKKHLCNLVSVNSRQIETFKSILKLLGIPILTSADEGEKLCVMLCRENKVDAVLSIDTDCLAYGCKFLITGFTQTHFKCTRLDIILGKLEYNIGNFVDLCISLKCDFNSNIPGMGLKTSKVLIDRFRFIDDFPEKYDTTPLDFCNCRHFFKTISSEKACVNLINLEYSKKKEIEFEFLNDINLTSIIEDLNEIDPYSELEFHKSDENIEWMKNVEEIEKYSPECTYSRNHKCNHKINYIIGESVDI